MRAHFRLLGASALAWMLLVPSAAAAGVVAPLSSIGVMPSPVTLRAVPNAIVPGLGIKTKDGYRDAQRHDLVASTGRGYCLAQDDARFRWMGSYGSSSRSPSEDLNLDRLIEKDGTATLERTRVHFDPPSGTITATGRSRVELKEVARTPAGVVVWAYREARTIVILAKRVERGIESRRVGGDLPFVSADGCPYAGARLDASKPEAGAFVQLVGALAPQGTGKDKIIPKFIVDASLSRVTRDPEPLLAVRVRMQN